MTAGSQSITATDAANSSITGSQTITVRGAATQSLAVTGFPNPDTAGTSGSLTITARDAYGNPAFGYSGTVQFSSSDGRATLPANYTFSASAPATHTFAIRLMTAGTQWITAADMANSAFKATNSGITVQPAALEALVVAGFSNPDTAGTTRAFTVTAVNSYGKVIPGYSGTVQFSSSDSHATLPASYTFTAADAGTHTFTATLVTAGSQSITTTDAANSSITGSQTITVRGAAARSLAVTGFPNPDTAGTSGSLTVTARDAYGNLATGYTGTIHFSSSDSRATLPASYTLTAANAGTHTFAATLVTAGSQSITATDAANSSITGSQTITVRGAAARSLAVTGFPNPDTAGTWGSLTITGAGRLRQPGLRLLRHGPVLLQRWPRHLAGQLYVLRLRPGDAYLRHPSHDGRDPVDHRG